MFATDRHPSSKERIVSLRLKCHSLHAVALASTVLVTSCGDGGSASVTPPASAITAAQRPVSQTDLEIAQTLYSGAPRTPDGFYQDTPGAEHSYVSTMHLKNTDLEATAAAPHPEHELCTDDWSQAFEWSETSASEAPQYADLVATNDDARFFEFNRVREGDPQFYLRERVFKCSYVDRDTADLRASEGSAGQLNERPLTAEELRKLVEYLWQFTDYNNFGHAVLKSSGASSATALSHTLTIANLVRTGISTACDRIDLIAWRHTADSSTGSLQVDTTTLLPFGAREESGRVELCSN